ncbi:MAG: hypothetical protein J0H99_27610, partial [Rhodospirillales bacterium]|nr:hypothetical protein [Rhodospirillales bacterium]
LILAGGGYLAWRTVSTEAVRDLQRSLAVAAEQATKILDAQALLADRVQDMLDDPDAPALLANEAELRDRIAAMIARFPQITGVLVLDGKGHPVASTTRFPVDRLSDFPAHGFFRPLDETGAALVIDTDPDGGLTGRPALIVARRRGLARFEGSIVVATSPRTIESFDRTLLAGNPAYVAGLFRSDGIDLARYPPQAEDERTPTGYHPLLALIAGQPLAGLVRLRSGVDGVERLVGYRRLETYPVYASVGRRWSSI